MKILGSILIAILGGVVAIFLYRTIERTGDSSSNDNNIASRVSLSRPATVSNSGTADSINNVFSVGFGSAAERTLSQVVHIRSRIAVRRDQMQEHLGDGFWEYFFRQNSWLTQQGMQESSGSGVIVSDDGYIVTNNHVIEQAQETIVSLYNGRSYPARVVGTDPSTDIAVLKIDDKGFKPATIGNSDQVRVGDWVLAVGNPFNLASTVTAGIVSAKARNIHILNDNSAIESFIQTDAAVNPGNSGGALVNLQGELIGINTAIATPSGTFAGYAFAVPSNIVRRVMNDIIEYGEVHRGYLGITIRDLDWRLAQDMGLDISQGVVVENTMNNGAADAAGIRPKDVILAIGNMKILNSGQLLEQVASHKPGDVLDIRLLRNGKERNVQVELKGNAPLTEARRNP